jgi:hypothetical protein
MTLEMLVVTPLVPPYCLLRVSSQRRGIGSSRSFDEWCSSALPLRCGCLVGTSEHHGLSVRSRRMIRETRIFSPLVLLSSCVPCAVPL